MSEENLKQIKISIQKYCKDADRDPEDVILIGASKSQSVDKINVAYEAGLNHFGENYLQEAENKIALTNKDITWHFIGAIQTRKAKKIAELFDWVHTVENIRVAERLNSARPADKPPLNVCIQLNIDEEDTKSGIKKEELENLITSLSHLENLVVRGLMVIPRPRETEIEQRKIFEEVTKIYKSLNQKGMNLDTLSMGMSSDFGSAIKEGATMIRIGTAIFGSRK